MFREQKARDLKQLETQFFYKQQEVQRLKAIFERLKREAVTRQSEYRREHHEVQARQHQLKETEDKIQKLDQEIVESIREVGERIKREREVIMEHERTLEELEQKKREIEGQKTQKKRSLSESLSRILFYKKKDEHESAATKKIFDDTQVQLHQIELSLKNFTQETHVLENKIRALRSSVK